MSKFDNPFMRERLTRLVPAAAMTTSQGYKDFVASLRAADRRERSVPDAAPVEVSAEAIVRCYRMALGELTDVAALDSDAPAGQIVKTYEKALGKECR